MSQVKKSAGELGAHRCSDAATGSNAPSLARVASIGRGDAIGANPPPPLEPSSEELRSAAYVVFCDIAQWSEAIHGLLVRIINGEDRADLLKVSARELAGNAMALANLACEAAEKTPSDRDTPAWVLCRTADAALKTLSGKGRSHE